MYRSRPKVRALDRSPGPVSLWGSALHHCQAARTHWNDDAVKFGRPALFGTRTSLMGRNVRSGSPRELIVNGKIAAAAVLTFGRKAGDEGVQIHEPAGLGEIAAKNHRLASERTGTFGGTVAQALSRSGQDTDLGREHVAALWGISTRIVPRAEGYSAPLFRAWQE